MPRRPVIALLLLVAFVVRVLAPGGMSVEAAMGAGDAINCHNAQAKFAFDAGASDSASDIQKKTPAGGQHDHANCALCQIGWAAVPAPYITPLIGRNAVVAREATRRPSRLVASSLLNRGAPPRASPLSA